MWSVYGKEFLIEFDGDSKMKPSLPGGTVNETRLYCSGTLYTTCQGIKQFC